VPGLALLSGVQGLMFVPRTGFERSPWGVVGRVALCTRVPRERELVCGRSSRGARVCVRRR